MTGADIITLLQAQFGAAIAEAKPEAIDPVVTISPDNLREVCRFLRDDPRLKFELLNCVTGVDYLEPEAKKLAKAGFEPHLEVVYHFSSFTHRHRFAVKLTMPRWKNDAAGQLPEVPSIADLYPTADWHERETFDLCGIQFTGHPDLRRILMAEDWDGHPLRKDYEFPLEYHGIRCR
ncbi:NADH-quinone oxidoreductase subunit C [Zavarzinella formosa]|uniref:NADH-quinone oxidoreductase subunit C n=1 Tax=Zavarzinella formosa TaxID=360055 RepID=UPI00031741CE|nr:NADH-quinone oxidoreductase subunit C [Zavarzinella formosa]